ncbi:MAG: hypothetical protein ACOCQQ_02710 [Candidatus Nanoarchaeia archaeon]
MGSENKTNQYKEIIRQAMKREIAPRQANDERNIYNKEARENMLKEDGIDPYEEAFMRGYEK